MSVFILTSPRSFSSVISTMIGQHPDLYGIPETSLFTADTVQQLFNDIPDPSLLNGLIRAISHILFGSQDVERTLAAYRYLLNHPSTKTSWVWDAMARAVHPRRLVEKSPIHCFKLEYLERLPADAHFIHLVRHPSGYARSLREYEPLAKLLPTERLFDSWWENQITISQFLRDVPAERKMVLRGEDLIQFPIVHLRMICRFLGVDDSNTAVSCMLFPEDSPFACVGNMWAPFGQDTGFLKNPEFRRHERVVESMEGVPVFVQQLALSYGYGCV